MTRIAVIDFETTGLSSTLGDRATEVGIVMVAAALSARIQADLCDRFDLPEAHHPLLMKVQASPMHAMAWAVSQFMAAA